MSEESFLNWLKTGNQPERSEGGGYLVPNFIYQKRPGLIARFLRLIKNKRGWIEIDVYKTFMEMIEKSRQQGKPQ